MKRRALGFWKQTQKAFPKGAAFRLAAAAFHETVALTTAVLFIQSGVCVCETSLSRTRLLESILRKSDDAGPLHNESFEK